MSRLRFAGAAEANVKSAVSAKRTVKRVEVMRENIVVAVLEVIVRVVIVVELESRTRS